MIDDSGHARVHTCVSDQVSQYNLEIIIPFLNKSITARYEYIKFSSNFTGMFKNLPNPAKCICLVSFKHLKNCLQVKELLW